MKSYTSEINVFREENRGFLHNLANSGRVRLSEFDRENLEKALDKYVEENKINGLDISVYKQITPPDMLKIVISYENPDLFLEFLNDFGRSYSIDSIRSKISKPKRTRRKSR